MLKNYWLFQRFFRYFLYITPKSHEFLIFLHISLENLVHWADKSLEALSIQRNHFHVGLFQRNFLIFRKFIEKSAKIMRKISRFYEKITKKTEKKQ